MDNANVFAYTEFKYESYPGYVSLNKRDGKYFLTVRSKEGSMSSEVEMSHSELVKMALAIPLLAGGSED